MIKKLIFNNSLFKNTGIYTTTSLINAAIPFFILPVLTRYLSPTDYGIVSMFTLLTTLISPLIGVNVSGAITRRYYDQDRIDISEYTYNSILVVISSSFLMAILFIPFGRVIGILTSLPRNFLWVALIYTLSINVISIILALWQVQKKARYYGYFLNLKTLLNVGLSLVFVIILNLKWEGRVYGQLAAEMLFATIAIVYLYRKKLIKLSINKKYIKDSLVFGLPLIPHALSGSIIAMTDRLFITNMVGIAATGVYTVGYQIGSILNLLTFSFNNAFVPWLYEKLKENNENTKRKIVKFTYLYFILIILIVIFLGLLAPKFLSVFLGKEFAESSSFVIWIALGYAFNGMYLMVVNYIFYAERNGLLAIVTFLTCIINVVLNYFFIKEYGAIGAALATTITYAIKFISVWILSAKVYKMPWKLK